MKILIYLAASLISFNIAFSGKTPEIDKDDLFNHVNFLASDSLRGRFPGTPEGKIAAEYIRDEFTKLGLELKGEDGFQYFDVVTSVQPGAGNKFSFKGMKAEVSKDFTPLSFSESGELDAKIAFAGYGFKIENDSVKWNDFESIDVSGKWVMMLFGDPDNGKSFSTYSGNGDMRQKVLLAKDNGAKGVLYVAGNKFEKEDKLIKLFYDKSASTTGIPVINITRKIADEILKNSGKTIDALESQLNDEKKPGSFEINEKLYAKSDIQQNKVTTQSIISVYKGSDPVLSNEYVVIGAHYDHLGFGGPGSGSRRPDTLAIHNGADDNASGVASMLELAEKIKKSGGLKRSVIFMAFGAEEMGLLGSKFFVKDPLIDLKDIKYMINLDMVGSLDTATNGFVIGGTGTAEGLEDVVKKNVESSGLSARYSPEGYGPSDHASFYINDIPVLFFFTGAKDTYHTPDDDTEHLNFPGQEKVTKLAYNIVKELANGPELLAFKESGPKYRTSYRRNFKVTLGIMPDHATDVKGMRADVVIPERPASNAGMLKGDVIVAMDGKPVNDIYEYMHRLNEFNPGQRISIEVMREGKKHILIVEF